MHHETFRELLNLTLIPVRADCTICTVAVVAARGQLHANSAARSAPSAMYRAAVSFLERKEKPRPIVPSGVVGVRGRSGLPHQLPDKPCQRLGRAEQQLHGPETGEANHGCAPLLGLLTRAHRQAEVIAGEARPEPRPGIRAAPAG